MPQAIRKKEPSPPLTPKLIRLLREAALYVLGALALYLLVALASYSGSDPSWSHRGGTDVVRNLGGPFGAFVSDLLFNLVGFLSYLVPVWIAYSGVKVFLNRKNDAPVDLTHKLVVGTGGVVAGLGACGLAALHFGGASVGLAFSSGGVVGDLVGSALVSAFSFIGATIVLLLVMFLPGLTVFLGISWLKVMDAVGWLVVSGVDTVRDQLAARKDRRIGEEAKEERKVVVARDMKKLERREPPKIEPVIPKIKPSERSERERQASLFDVPEGGELPALSLLDEAGEHLAPQFSRQSLESMSRLLEKKLLDFNIEAQVVEVHPGPVITRFELEPAAGVKASQITNLATDLARSMSVVSLRVVEVIPGKTTVGIEVPNESRETVRLREVLSSQEFDDVRSPLALALGKDISGKPVVEDLAKMPHLLIAGTTGSGKSVSVNGLIMSMVYKATPDQVRLIMVDPKMLELSIYEGIPHLLAPVVTDMKQAATALRWCIGEMERRYRLMAALGVRNIGGYNRKVKDAAEAGKPLKDPLFEPIEGIDEEAPELKALPYIVILIDELADMMMVVGKKVEQLIARLAQKARAAGLHLILATQRPSVDVITGLIKANIPARIAFQVSSRVDSRTVLDQMGAEQLLGHGDMLFLQPGQGVPLRVHGSFVDDHEVHNVVNALKKNGKPAYDDSILSPESLSETPGSAFSAGMSGDDESDPLYDEALAIVTETRKASISGVQRRLRIGYNRAARLIEQMEKSGVVGPLQSNGSREVLAPPPPKG
ncbi:MAG: DNA translocase FtsK 4TM domain-containing protein [Gammaproteobacteria bacterium]|nr:DNA translocase FtsK 4TM domain-containing protein [Gammaproteobacteria bacterium]